MIGNLLRRWRKWRYRDPGFQAWIPIDDAAIRVAEDPERQVPEPRCIVCNSPLAPVLVRLGSTKCHDHRSPTEMWR